MRNVMISIRPKWCELIASGQKTIEVRKTAPKEVPFKAYIYCTNDRKVMLERSNYDKSIYLNGNIYYPHKVDCSLNGKVIGEFICNEVLTVDCDSFAPFNKETGDYIKSLCCLDRNEFWDYTHGKCAYGWYISDLVIYDKLKELKEFIVPTDGTKDCCDYFDSKGNNHCRKCPYFDAGDSSACIEDDCCGVYYFDTTMYHPLFRPPQSWMYVENMEDNK